MGSRLTPIVKYLLIINVATLLIGMLLNINMVEHFGLRYIKSPEFAPYQVFTHIFVHAGLMHLVSNMIGLFIFGPILESYMGSNRFLSFYLITALGASVLFSTIDYFEKSQLQEEVLNYRHNPTPEKFTGFLQTHAPHYYQQNLSFIESYRENPENSSLQQQSVSLVKELGRRKINTPMVGASGAIFGILMAFALLFPNVELFLLFFPFPIKAKYFVAIYGFYEFFSGIQRTAGDNVAHFAHLGGMLFAFILVKYWRYR